MGDQGKLKERVTHSAKQAKGLMTLSHTSLSLFLLCGWVAMALGRGSKENKYSIAYWVDREQTFPQSQSGGMNWLCDSDQLYSCVRLPLGSL